MYTKDNLLSMRNMKLQFSSHSTDTGQLSFSRNGAFSAPHNRTPSSLLFAEWDPEADHQTDGERGTYRLLGRAGEISLRRAPRLPGAALRKGGRALFRGGHLHCALLVPLACPSLKGTTQANERRAMIKPKTTGFWYRGRHCSAEGIGPNVGRASKGDFPRAKGKCDQGGITPPPTTTTTKSCSLYYQTLLYHCDLICHSLQQRPCLNQTFC